MMESAAAPHSTASICSTVGVLVLRRLNEGRPSSSFSAGNSMAGVARRTTVLIAWAVRTARDLFFTSGATCIMGVLCSSVQAKFLFQKRHQQRKRLLP